MFRYPLEILDHSREVQVHVRTTVSLDKLIDCLRLKNTLHVQRLVLELPNIFVDSADLVCCEELLEVFFHHGPFRGPGEGRSGKRREKNQR